jgi:hypothetical protein
MPLGRWFRGDLGTLLAARIDERPVGQIFDPEVIRRLTDDHASGRADRAAKLHALIYLDHWLERWT